MYIEVNLDGIKLRLKFLGKIVLNEQFVSHHVVWHIIGDFVKYKTSA